LPTLFGRRRWFFLGRLIQPAEFDNEIELRDSDRFALAGPTSRLAVPVVSLRRFDCELPVHCGRVLAAAVAGPDDRKCDP
jgi:hypothetical protein